MIDKVGVVGLGAMGTPMAHRLLQAGFEVTVYDVLAERREQMCAVGATEAQCPEEVAGCSDVVIIMVATPEQADEAIFGPRGVASGVSRGQTLVLTSTVGPQAARALAQRLDKNRLSFLDAPVSGGTVGARNGDLLIMVGGEEEVLATAHPVLKILGSKVEWCGSEVGDGQSVKLVNQLLCGVHLAAAGEAIAFAKTLGLDPHRTYEIIRQGAAYSFMMDDRIPRMLSVDPVSIESALDIFVKDTGLVLDAVKDSEFWPVLAAAANKLYREGAEAGLGREDDSCVERVYRIRGKEGEGGSR